MIRKSRPVLFIDDGKESKAAIQLFEKAGIAYVTYHIKKLEESCCGEVPTPIPIFLRPFNLVSYYWVGYNRTLRYILLSD